MPGIRGHGMYGEEVVKGKLGPEISSYIRAGINSARLVVLNSGSLVQFRIFLEVSIERTHMALRKKGKVKGRETICFT